MNVEEGITGLTLRFSKRKVEIIVCVIFWTFIFSTTWLVSQFDQNFLDEWKFQTPDILTTVVTMFTGLILHRDFIHFFLNTLGFVLVMPIFILITQKSIFKASLWFILVGLSIRVLQIIFYFITILIFELGKNFYFIIFERKIFVPIYPLTSVGASGALMGIIGYVFIWFRGLEKKEKWIFTLHKKDLPIEYMYYFAIQASVTLGVFFMFLTDVNNFNAVYGEPIQFLFSKSVLWNSTFTYGNPYFSHTIGFLLGILLCFRNNIGWGDIIINDINEKTDRKLYL